MMNKIVSTNKQNTTSQANTIQLFQLERRSIHAPTTNNHDHIIHIKPNPRTSNEDEKQEDLGSIIELSHIESPPYPHRLRFIQTESLKTRTNRMTERIRQSVYPPLIQGQLPNQLLHYQLLRKTFFKWEDRIIKTRLTQSLFQKALHPETESLTITQKNDLWNTLIDSTLINPKGTIPHQTSVEQLTVEFAKQQITQPLIRAINDLLNNYNGQQQEQHLDRFEIWKKQFTAWEQHYRNVEFSKQLKKGTFISLELWYCLAAIYTGARYLQNPETPPYITTELIESVPHPPYVFSLFLLLGHLSAMANIIIKFPFLKQKEDALNQALSSNLDRLSLVQFKEDCLELELIDDSLPTPQPLTGWQNWNCTKRYIDNPYINTPIFITGVIGLTTALSINTFWETGGIITQSLTFGGGLLVGQQLGIKAVVEQLPTQPLITTIATTFESLGLFGISTVAAYSIWPTAPIFGNPLYFISAPLGLGTLLNLTKLAYDYVTTNDHCAAFSERLKGLCCSNAWSADNQVAPV